MIFLEYGWPINYSSSQIPWSTLHDHPSTRQAENPTFLHEYIAKELQHHAIIGPFNHNPFNTNCTISSLQCAPRRDSMEPRIVHDLSFPLGHSVNDGYRKMNIWVSTTNYDYQELIALWNLLIEKDLAVSFSRQTYAVHIAKFL